MIDAKDKESPIIGDKANPDGLITPKHYQSESGMQPWDVVAAFGLGFNLGNVVKYICRAGKKGDYLEDLRKAMTYLQNEINRQSDRKAKGGPT